MPDDHNPNLPSHAPNPRKLDLLRLPQREPDDPAVRPSQIVTERVLPHTLTFAPDGTLWGCGPGGVIRWTVSAQHTSYKLWRDAHGLADADPTCLAATRDRVVVGHRTGEISVYRDAERAWAVRHLEDQRLNFPIRGLVPSAEGRLWALTDAAIVDVDSSQRLVPPEAPLHGLSAQGALWIGTVGGVYRWKGGQWTAILKVKTGSVRALVAAGSAFWAVSTRGVWVITAGEAQPRIAPVDLPVADGAQPSIQAAVGDADTVCLLADGKLHYFTPEGSLRTSASAGRASLMAMNADQFVLGAPRKLHIMSRREHIDGRDLLPKIERPEPDEVWQQIGDGSAGAIVQTTSGEVWRRDAKRGWERLDLPLAARGRVALLRGGGAFGEKTLLCLEGLPTRLTEDDEAGIAFCAGQGLAIVDGEARLETNEGILTSHDGQHWES